MCVNRFIIEQDLKRLGVTDFYIEEKVFENQKVIPLRSNEILYINYFNVETHKSSIYFVKLQSNDNFHKYHEKNTKIVFEAIFIYESNLLLRFNTSIKIVKSSSFSYFIQAYLVTINTHKTQCQDKNE